LQALHVALQTLCKRSNALTDARSVLRGNRVEIALRLLANFDGVSHGKNAKEQNFVKPPFSNSVWRYWSMAGMEIGN